MNTQPQGFFNGTNGKDASNKLPYFPAGFLGRLNIDNVKGITNLEGQRAYIVEFTVETSNMPDKVFVGGRYSWYQALNPKQLDTAYGACIAFLYAALQYDPARDQAKINAEVKPRQDFLLNSSISDVPIPANPQLGTPALPAQYLRNSKVLLQTSEKPTKAGKGMPIEQARATKGALFTLHTFSPGVAAAAA